jgi:hypothetical protein
VEHKKGQMMGSRVFLVFALFLLPGQANAEHLNVTEGTMALGGSVGVNYASADIRETGSVALNFDLLYSYFVIDGLAPGIGLRVRANLGGNANPLQNQIGQSFGAMAGLGYYIDVKSIVFPYAQIFGVLEYSKESWSMAPISELRAVAAPSLGLLVGLNRNVALDFGIAADFSFPLVESTRATVQVTSQIGYFGVRGFF